MARTPVRVQLEVLRGSPYKFLWLKKVRNFDPSNHCARCLLGEFRKDIIPFGAGEHGHVGEGEVPLTGSQALYLCGVTDRYQRNVHLPVEFAEGEIVEQSWPCLTVRMENARILPIPVLTTAAAKEAGLRTDRQAVTCRNYQFAYAHFGVAQPSLL